MLSKHFNKSSSNVLSQSFRDRILGLVIGTKKIYIYLYNKKISICVLNF